MAVVTYRGADGIRRIAERLAGNETIHVGIRPFGLHAGNVLGIVAYPHLLCRVAQDIGKIPKFRLIVSINDWEQDAPSGPDPVRYPYNIVPRETTLQFSAVVDGQSVVDRWEPRIRAAYAPFLAEFPSVGVEFRRTSRLRRDHRLAPFLAKTLGRAGQIAHCLAKHSTHEVLTDGPTLFASVVCPACRAARGDTRFRADGSTVFFRCTACAWTDERTFLDFDWWWHHKPMFLARWYLWGVDVAVSGGDHLVDGDADIRDVLRQIFELEERELLMLFAPLLVDRSGVKVSKSARNEVTVPYDSLLVHAARTDNLRLPVTSLEEHNTGER